MIDYPNERSQHERPITVGAGVVFALLAPPLYVLLDGMSLASPLFPGWLWLVGFALAGVGFYDDRFELPVTPRMLAYIGASAALIFAIPPGGGWMLALPVALALAWLVNLYNFMDGIDALAATQAVVMAAGLIAMSALPGGSPEIAKLALPLILVLVPFLFFNWPPASMFMGDAGAIYLGFYLGMMGLAVWQVAQIQFAAYLILMMPFLVDATCTLGIRLLKGYPPHLGHRDHLYQRAVSAGGETRRVVLGLLALQVGWQLPLALFSIYSPDSQIFAVIFSTIPTISLLVYYRLRP